MAPIPTPSGSALSFREAALRVAVTAVQAGAAFILALSGLLIAGEADATSVSAAAVGSFLVPVTTAVHRFSGAWLAARGSGS